MNGNCMSCRWYYGGAGVIRCRSCHNNSNYLLNKSYVRGAVKKDSPSALDFIQELTYSLNTGTEDPHNKGYRLITIFSRTELCKYKDAIDEYHRTYPEDPVLHISDRAYDKYGHRVNKSLALLVKDESVPRSVENFWNILHNRSSRDF